MRDAGWMSGDLHLPELRAELEVHFTESVTAMRQDQDQEVA